MRAITVDQSFPTSEHLKHKKLFDEIFAKGNRHFSHPVMAIWVETTLPDETPIQVGFSASKKHYKTAVKRNLLKRRMREAYRTQKAALVRCLAEQNRQIALFFVTVKTDNTSYEALQPKINLLLREIEGKLRNAK